MPTSYSYSNGKSTSLTYNSRYFPSRITSSGAVDMGYTYDSRGNTTAITNYLDTPKNQTFTYDNLSRLTGYNGAWGTGSYTYNSTGNRLKKIVAGTTTNYNYSSNRVSSTTGGEPATFSYNGYGSLTGETCGGGSYTLTYDNLNNLKTFKQGTNTLASFAYDGDGMRVTKTTWKTIVYHYDKDGRTLSETDNNGNLIADYIYLNGKLVAKAEPSNLYFYHTDPAGTALAMTNTSGTVVWKTDYKPFGEEQSITSTIENNEKFAGKEKDKETGLYYFGARYLGPKTGHFITVDPVGAVNPRTGKANEKNLLNPQRLNLYAYSLNNPYRYVDPDGAMATEIGATVGTFIAPGPGTAIGGLSGAAIDAGIGLIVGYGVYKIGEAIYNKATDNNEDAGPKEGSTAGPGSGKRFPEKVKDTAESQADSKCVFCGNKTTREPGPNQRNTDHAVPKSRGGNNTLDNAQNTCRNCNLDKGAKTTKEYINSK